MSARKLIVGFALILIGLLFLGRTMDLFYFSAGDFFGNLLPLGLVGLGVWLIVKRQRSDRMQRNFEQTQQAYNGPQEVHRESSFTRADPPPRGEESRRTGPSFSDSARQSHMSEAPSASAPGKLKYQKAFGDMYIDLDGLNLQSVEVSTFLGDVEIKLHGGILGSGLNRMVISGFIGDVRVMVPHGMAVYAQASSFIGDVELFGNRTDGFGNNLEGQTANYETAEVKLYIATNCFIGDVRIFEI